MNFFSTWKWERIKKKERSEIAIEIPTDSTTNSMFHLYFTSWHALDYFKNQILYLIEVYKKETLNISRQGMHSIITRYPSQSEDKAD